MPSWWMGSECHHGGWVVSAIMVEESAFCFKSFVCVVAVGGGLEATPIYMYSW